LFYVVIAASWLGASLAAREIVKERPILRRERAVGLSVSAYLASKVVVLGVLTVLQAVVLVAIALARQDGPASGVLMGWGVGEVMIGVALGGLASMAMGLLLSSLARTSDMALTFLPMVLIVQNVLAVGGVFPEVVNKPVLEQLSYVASAQWSFSTVASTADLNQLQSATNVLRGLSDVDLRDPSAIADRLTVNADRGARRFDHERSVWLMDVTAVLALTFAFVIATWVVLVRRTEERR
jgi:hypothetical protein